jgi:HD-GYP domain-containing protein (c-di-GMP phosphodiesterase class II)
VFEAVASDRPYRPGLGLEAAMEALEEGRGTAFDTKVVDTCRTLYNEGFEFDADCARFALSTTRRSIHHA